MPAYNEKPKNLGSAYINVKKGTSEEILNGVSEAIEFLKDNGAYLKLSIRNSAGGYTSLTGFFNGFKKEAKDADIVLRASTVGTPQQGQSQSRFAPKGGFKSRPTPSVAPKKEETTDEFDGEGVPF